MKYRSLKTVSWSQIVEVPVPSLSRELDRVREMLARHIIGHIALSGFIVIALGHRQPLPRRCGGHQNSLSWGPAGRGPPEGNLQQNNESIFDISLTCICSETRRFSIF